MTDNWMDELYRLHDEDKTKQQQIEADSAQKGPLSAAKRPNPEDPQDYNYIAIGVRSNKLFVNDKEVKSITPEALKAALVEAAKNPGKVKQKKSSK